MRRATCRALCLRSEVVVGIAAKVTELLGQAHLNGLNAEPRHPRLVRGLHHQNVVAVVDSKHVPHHQEVVNAMRSRHGRHHQTGLQIR